MTQQVLEQVLSTREWETWQEKDDFSPDGQGDHEKGQPLKLGRIVLGEEEEEREGEKG